MACEPQKPSEAVHRLLRLWQNSSPADLRKNAEDNAKGKYPCGYTYRFRGHTIQDAFLIRASIYREVGRNPSHQ